MKNPNVFISHASEDKNRFVLGFAERLYSKGVKAWVDKWEMLPGDSLVNKIFDEGLKDSDAIIVVISSFSAHKPWVQEEINAAFTKRLAEKCKIIPIVLDNAPVPECLKSTLWENITDTTNYEENFERIVAAIYGTTIKPQLGEIPTYINTTTANIPGLSKEDSLVLNAFCAHFIDNNSISPVEPSEIFSILSNQGLSLSTFNESIEILFRKGYIKGTHTLDGNLHLVTLPLHTIDNYIKNNISNFKEIQRDICYRILNNPISNLDYAHQHNIPILIVNHVYDLLEQQNLISTQKTISGLIIVYDVSPELRRILSHL